MKAFYCAFVFALGFVLSGCASVLDLTGQRAELDRMRQQSKLSQHHMKEPDLAAWRNQREQITQALVDRVFDKAFDRVFDSLPIALASMGLTVDNMERQSGHMAAHGQILAPEKNKQFRSEEMVAWCIANGYDPSLLQQRGRYNIDPDMDVGMMGGFGTTLTISLVRQSEKQTKVKLRLNGINYPRTLEESYKALWLGLNKQIFLDKSTD